MWSRVRGLWLFWWGFFMVLMAVLISWSSLRHTMPYTMPSVFLKGKEAFFSFYLPALYGHIATSGIILLLGFVSLLQLVRNKWMAVHRLAGKIYVGLILFISAPCGLIMACCSTGGWGVKICFIALSILWWWFTKEAWKSIKAGNISTHQFFMWRSYALTLSAVTLRWYSFLVAYFLQWRGEEVYLWLAWASWVPNLLLVEWWIQKKMHASNQG